MSEIDVDRGGSQTFFGHISENSTTFTQTFVATGTAITNLTFPVDLDSSSSASIRILIAEVTGTNTVGTILYTSDPITIDSISGESLAYGGGPFRDVNLTMDVPVTPGAQYVLIFDAVTDGNGTDNIVLGWNNGDTYTDGTMGWWYGDPAEGLSLNNNSFGGDYAFTMTFADVNVIDGTPGDDTLVGTSGEDQINGYGGNDTLLGQGDDDELNGGDGHDRLIGGGGNDSNYGGSGDDYITGGFGDDLIDGGDGYDRAGWYHTNPMLGGVTVDLNLQGVAQDTGAQGWDTLVSIEYLSGTPFADTLIGDGNDNILWGSSSYIDGVGLSGANDDTLDGGGGNDLLVAGIGNHSLTGGNGTDTVSFTENFGDDPAVSISLALQGAAQDTGQGLWTLNGIENLSGGDDNDSLTGDDNANVLAGNAGDDALIGGGGNDSLYGDGQFNADTHGTGGSGPAILIPDTGAAGNDTLEGGLGDDHIDGGAGTDTASYVNALGGVGVWLGGGYSWGADGNDTLVNIENVIGSDHADEIAGDDNANNLEGGAGNDGVFGEGGDDTVSGGDGHDDVRGGAGNDTLYGGADDDLLYGNAGDDYIDGGDGYDRVGYYSGATAGVTVDLNLQGSAQDTGQGWDTLVNIENVSGTVFGDILTGDGNDNVLWGSGATISPGNVATTNNDTLIGGGGNDLLIAGIGNHAIDGGDGIDTFSFTENGMPETGITLSLLLQGSAQASGNGDWTLTGIENLSGSLANDSLTGDSNANVLAGNAGDDNLSGGDGNDTLYGDGDINWDTHGVGGSGPIVTTADTGAAGNDTLEGGLGDDHIDGGLGSDTASYANALGGVEIYLWAGEAYGADGTDTLVNIENVTGSDYGDWIIADDNANLITGGGGDDTIVGLGGDDTLEGGDGHDYLEGNDGADQLYGGADDDYLYGNAGDDLIDGGAGWDRAGFSFGATGGVTVDLNLQGIAQNTGQGWDTLVGIEHVSGTRFSDIITGDAGDNWLWGGSDGSGVTGDDTISAGDGNDLVEVGNGNHTLDGGAGNDTLLLYGNGTDITSAGVTFSLALQGSAQDSEQGLMNASGFENLSGSIYDDNLTGDSGDNILAGDAGADTLVGGEGNDTLYGDGGVYPDTHGGGGSGPIGVVADNGAAGDDMLEGGLGDDYIDGGEGSDTASYVNALGGVFVNLGGGFASGADGFDTLVNVENVIGSGYDDNLTGNFGDNLLSGGDGNDFIVGRAGNDTVDGGAGQDLVRGDAGDDILIGGDGSDNLRGGSGVDSFDGGDHDAGYTNTAGWGDRVSFYETGATQGVVADLRTGIISNDGFGNVETMTGIESLGSDTAFVDTFYGNDESNLLLANLGDYLYGFGGDDDFFTTSAAALVDGGDGTDTLALGSYGGWLMPDANADGQAEIAEATTGGWVVNLTTGYVEDGYGNAGSVSGIENVDGSENGDSLTGDAGANTLNGWNGDDVIEGAGGDDTLDGGDGSDTASYANAAGAVEAYLYAGVAFGADGSDTLANIENLTGSAYADVLFGDGAANVLSGGGGNDTIVGLGGDDTLEGGDGHDYLEGSGGADQLYGGADDDYLYGNAGDDLIDGGAGWDRAGFSFGATGGVTVDLNLQGIAQNTGQGWDTLVGIEHVSGTRFSDTITGDAGDNWLWGGSDGSGVTGDDTISAGDGNDLVTVGAGNHLLDGGSGNDTLSLYGNGTDISSAGVTFSLALQGAAQDSEQGLMNASGFENLVGSIYDDSLTGDSSDNILAGVEGNDTLVGGDGNDTLYGDGTIHADTHGTGRSGPIVTVEDSGAAGNDTLIGGKGNDSLYGGAGDDLLTGGQGQDLFVFGAGSGDDVITDFGGGQDTILFDSSSGVTDFSQLTFTKSGNDVIVTWGTDDSIVLDGVKLKDIDSASFQFEGASLAAMAFDGFDKPMFVDSWSGPTDYLI